MTGNPLQNLRAEVETLGKRKWRPMLAYVAELHARSILPPRPPFERPIEEIGPGYCYAPVFGHWDITHALFDSIPSERGHARDQILNILAGQQPDGMWPGLFRLLGGQVHFSREVTHPPVWPFAADAWRRAHNDLSLLPACLDALRRQIASFEKCRRAPDGGFYYRDIEGSRCWESGIDDGVRFIECPPGRAGMVDATAHVYALYDFAAQWSAALGRNAAPWEKKARALRDYIRNELFDRESGFFYDSWVRKDAARRTAAFEGMWPVVAGAATVAQAAAVVREHLLNPRRFFTPHPIATVGIEDPRFELRCWRGPAWNSMTHWAALGCLRYGHRDAARRLLEAALDDSAEKFMSTGTIWEFYHPLGGRPDACRRKPYTPYNAPCINYLGHNPLIAMARQWERAAAPSVRSVTETETNNGTMGWNRRLRRFHRLETAKAKEESILKALKTRVRRR